MKHLLRRRWKFGFPVVMLALVGAGVAVAASQSASSDATSVCVNNTNGLVRVATDCRDSEHPMTIGGGGGDGQVTSGSFTIAWGASGGAKALPLTGATIAGRCDVIQTPGGSATTARPSIDASTGSTMDVFPGGTGQTSILLPPVDSVHPGGSSGQVDTAILRANGATATVTFGGTVDPNTHTCTFLWQAVEGPN